MYIIIFSCLLLLYAEFNQPISELKPYARMWKRSLLVKVRPLSMSALSQLATMWEYRQFDQPDPPPLLSLLYKIYISFMGCLILPGSTSSRVKRRPVCVTFSVILLLKCCCIWPIFLHYINYHHPSILWYEAKKLQILNIEKLDTMSGLGFHLMPKVEGELCFLANEWKMENRHEMCGSLNWCVFNHTNWCFCQLIFCKRTNSYIPIYLISFIIPL